MHLYGQIQNSCRLTWPGYSGQTCWCEKTGDQAIGTADKVYDILLRQLNAGIHNVKRFKTDHGLNLMGAIIKYILKRMGIQQDIEYGSLIKRMKKKTPS